jgi:chromosome segregation ATPase
MEELKQKVINQLSLAAADADDYAADTMKTVNSFLRFVAHPDTKTSIMARLADQKQLMAVGVDLINAIKIVPDHLNGYSQEFCTALNIHRLGELSVALDKILAKVSIVRKNRELLADQQSRKQTVEQAEAKIAAANSEAAAAKAQLEKNKEETQATIAEMSIALANSAKSAAAAISKATAKANADIEAVKAELAKASSSSVSKSTNDRELAQLNASLKDANAQVAAAAEEIKKLKETALAAEVKLSASNKDIEALKATIKSMEADKASALQISGKVEARLIDLNDKLAADNKKLTEELEAVRNAPIAAEVAEASVEINAKSAPKKPNKK